MSLNDLRGCGIKNVRRYNTVNQEIILLHHLMYDFFSFSHIIFCHAKQKLPLGRGVGLGLSAKIRTGQVEM